MYPQNYKNDPLWFQVNGTTGVRDTAIFDVPATSSAADNYVHGLVTVNDSKGSETKEAILDMVSNSLLSVNTYTNTRAISAQEGNATSGSEDRLIPISGDFRVSQQIVRCTLNCVVLRLQDLVTTRSSILDSVLVTTHWFPTAPGSRLN